MEGLADWLEGAPCGRGHPCRNGSKKQEMQCWWSRWAIGSEQKLKVWKPSQQKAALNLRMNKLSAERERERPKMILDLSVVHSHSRWANKLKGLIVKYISKTGGRKGRWDCGARRNKQGLSTLIAYYQIHLSVPLLYLHYFSLMRWHLHCLHNVINNETSRKFSFPSESVGWEEEATEINQPLHMNVCFLLPGQFHSKGNISKFCIFLDSDF